MLLTRFWMVLITAALSVAVVGVLLARESQVRITESTTSSRLERDRGVVSLLLRLESRQRAAALLRISSASDVRVALARPASFMAEGEEGANARRRLRATLQTLNSEMSEMAGDIIFALDSRGRIVAQLGDSPERRPSGSGLAQFPLAAQALRGFLRDDVWVYNDRVYAMVARPVIHSGRLVGAVLHGREMNDEFARVIARKLPSPSSLFLYRGERVIGSASGAGASDSSEALLTSQSIEQAISEMDQGGEDSEDEPQRVRSVAEGNGIATFGPFTGSAAHAGVGYALGTTMPSTPSPMSLILDAPEQDLAALPTTLLGAGALLLILFGLVLVWLERDRPMKAFGASLESLAAGNQGRLEISKFGGRFRTYAQSLNEAIDTAVEREGGQLPKESNANIDALLGDSDSQSYFGFADLEDRASIPAAPEMLEAIEQQAAATKTKIEFAESIPPENLMTLPPEEFLTLAEDKAPPHIPVPSVPSEAEEPEAEEPESESAPGTPEHQSFAEAGSAPTEVADASTALLEQSREADGPSATDQGASDDGEDDEEEESHFIDTFQRYLTLREECGESTAGITFTRLRSTLEKNRDKILSKHPGSLVRFTVYVKNGRAAIKAKRQA